MDYRSLYKSIRIPSLADALARRSQNIVAERQEKQREIFWSKRRNLDSSLTLNNSKPIEKKTKSRAEMLKEWKIEKLKRIEEAKKKQKPIFKVGVVQRKATGSPILISQKKSSDKIKKIDSRLNLHISEENKQIITRSKAKNADHPKNQSKPPEMHKQVEKQKSQSNSDNRFYKIEAGKQKPIDSYVFKVPKSVSLLSFPSKLTLPFSPKIGKKNKRKQSGKSGLKKQSVETILEKHQDGQETLLFEEKTEEKVEESDNNKYSGNQITPSPAIISDADDCRPIHYSPFVTIRSNKGAPKTPKKSSVINIDEQIQKEEQEFQCRIFSFRKYIECESKRLIDTCEKWKHIYKEFQEIPPDIEGDIDCVIGKTNLLTSDKFMQFKDLIEKCEKGDPLIKINDLQGFQDWVSIEVERIDEDFHKLEKKKCNNWVLEMKTSHVEKVPTTKFKKIASKKAVGKSNIRAHIEAARKLLNEENLKMSNPQFSDLPMECFIKTNTPKEKGNSLKDVLISETKKKTKISCHSKSSPILRERQNSGLKIMAATEKNKFLTPNKTFPKHCNAENINFINQDMTPSKSILKKNPTVCNKSSSKGKVTFKQAEENFNQKKKGLNEKYFLPSRDDDSPIRSVLGDLGNRTPSGIITRSRSSKGAQSLNT